MTTEQTDRQREVLARQRALIARIGAYSLWARVEDRTARTEAARRKFMSRFEREVDPDGKLTPEERAKRAAAARSAYFSALALRAARKRAPSQASRRPAARR